MTRCVCVYFSIHSNTHTHIKCIVNSEKLLKYWSIDELEYELQKSVSDKCKKKNGREKKYAEKGKKKNSFEILSFWWRE